MKSFAYYWYIWRENGTYEEAVQEVNENYVCDFLHSNQRNTILVLAENEEQAYRRGRSFVLAGDRSFCKKNNYFD